MNDPAVGWASIPNWLLRDPSVGQHEKMVYLVLSGRVGHHEVVWPSQALIAAEASMSESSVKRALRKLTAMGLVTVQVERTSHGRRNIYRLHAHPTPPPGWGVRSP